MGLGCAGLARRAMISSARLGVIWALVPGALPPGLTGVAGAGAGVGGFGSTFLTYGP
jgi:hypothetical protein